MCRLLRLTNRAPGEGFWADPYDRYGAFQLLAATELTLLAIYHSHPHGPARLSRADVQ